MLSERILVSFVIFIDYFSVLVYAHALYWEGCDALWTSAIRRYGVELCISWEISVFSILLDCCRKDDSAVVEYGYRCLVTRMCCEFFRTASFLGYHEYVLASFSCWAEDDILSVRCPDRSSVIGRICCQLSCISSVRVHYIYIAFICEGDFAAVRWYAVAAEPEGSLLCCCHCCRCCKDGKDWGYSFHCYQCYVIWQI